MCNGVFEKKKSGVVVAFSLNIFSEERVLNTSKIESRVAGHTHR